MTTKESKNLMVMSNKIVYMPKCGFFTTHVEDALWLAQKHKLPVILKYERNNMIITPGEGQIMNNSWSVLRRAIIASQCEYGF